MGMESDHPGGVVTITDADAPPPHPIDHNEFFQDPTTITSSNRMRNIVR